MTENHHTDGTKRTRRSVLKSGAVAAGSVSVVGLAAGQQNTPRGEGGQGFLTVDDFRKPPADDRSFVINGLSPFVLEHSPGCGGNPNAPTRRYQGYEIEYQGPTGLKLATLFLESTRNVETGIVQDFVSTQECPPEPTIIDTRTDKPLSGSFPLLRVSFGPVE